MAEVYTRPRNKGTEVIHPILLPFVNSIKNFKNPISQNLSIFTQHQVKHSLSKTMQKFNRNALFPDYL